MFQRYALYTTSYTTLTPTPVAGRFRRRSATARLLGSRIRIPLRSCMFVSCECGYVLYVAASTTSWSLVQGSSNVCVCLTVCDLETYRIPCLLQTPEGHYCFHNSPQLEPILSQINPVHSILLYFNILFIIIIIIMGRDNSVDIVTRYELDGPGIESRRGRVFPHSPRRPWGSPPTVGTGSFPGVKRPGCGVNHPHP